MRTINLILEIDLDEAPDEERQAGAFDGELPSVDEVTSHELALLVRAWLRETDMEFWAGTDLYAQIADVRIVNHAVVEA